MSSAGPLTAVDARVAAAILAHHPRRQPTWAGIAQRLTAWADQQPHTEHEEGEMPSQDRVSRSADGTLGSSKTPPKCVNTPRADHLTVEESR